MLPPSTQKQAFPFFVWLRIAYRKAKEIEAIFCVHNECRSTFEPHSVGCCSVYSALSNPEGHRKQLLRYRSQRT
jgi:hypothetical protein